MLGKGGTSVPGPPTLALCFSQCQVADVRAETPPRHVGSSLDSLSMILEHPLSSSGLQVLHLQDE